MSKTINAFPGYEFKFLEDGKQHNMYRGVDLGKGGYVYAEPGMYGNVAVLDVASLHPHSIVAMNVFGKYTKTFKDLMDARLYIKHGEYDKAGRLFNGKLAPYLKDKESAKQLSNALKIGINSVYGLTSATFRNPFQDPRNKNNIVALRGALFMKTLQDEVQTRGFRVAHIKTDSIKIPDATNEIIAFCMHFAKEYGYTFEHEGTYEKFCLVNDAVFVAKNATMAQCESLYGKEYVNNPEVLGDNRGRPGAWSATGAQFQVPYVFKKIFTKEPIVFDDLCETKQVTTALYLRTGEDLRFVGRIGRFCPMTEGGGELLRESTGKDGEKKYHAAVGSKDYLWMESEVVRVLGLEDKIDRSYYDILVDKAYKTLGEHGDVEWFLSEDPYIPTDFPGDAPPWD